jgi:apolipoprotein N-acyltransferase
VLSGVALWTSFPPLGAWPVAIVGVAGLTLLVRGSTKRQAAGLGFLAGLGLWIPLVSFLRLSFGFEAWAAVAVLESFWYLGLGLALRVVQRSRWWPLTGGLVWVAQEFARDRWPFDGFPWGRLAFSQANSPLVHLAAVGGAPLVSFAVAVLGGLLALAWLHLRSGAVPVRATRRALTGAAAVGGIAVVVAGPLAIHLPTGGTTRDGAPSSAVIAAVQGNVPRLGLKEFAQRRAVTTNHLQQTERLASEVESGTRPQPQLVVWPENASDLDPRVDLVANELISTAARAIGVPILVGAVLNGPGPNHVQNAAIVWSPITGAGQIYVKRHLVPFGEYIPFRSFITKLSSKFSLIPKDFSPGHTPGTMLAGGIELADAICFEVADDTIVRQAVTGGGRIIVVQTNNADYEQQGNSGNGGETAQQLAISRLRAVEHGRAVVIAATSGVSAMIAPNGKVLAKTGVFTPALLERQLPLRDPLTLADRVGGWPERALSVLGLLAILWGTALPRRRTAGPSPDLDPDADPADPAGATPTYEASPAGAARPTAR